jgi:biotin carboxyl carrier protein
MSTAIDGRRFVKELVALAKAGEDGRTVLAAPMPGFYRDAPMLGGALAPGNSLGELEVLGVSYRLIVPPKVHGAVVEIAPAEGRARRLARRPVAFGEALLTIDPATHTGVGVSNGGVENTSRGPSGALVFCAPMSGRYYAKPAPDAEPFVRIGAMIEVGQSVALLEVMKTFNRVQYGGNGMPARAKIVSIIPNDGDDVRGGDPLFEIEST